MAGQPKLLVNAQLDKRSAANGLEREFQQLLTLQPQPAWIGYMVPSVRSVNLGCEYVSPEGRSVPGVVHLEPPDHAIILFRVTGGAVERVRVLSPDCEIDAGGVPVHWLDDVRPPESVALLGTLDRRQTVMAIAVEADPAADAALERMVASDQPEATRRQAAFWIGAAQGRRGLDTVKKILETDTSQRVRERAVSGVAASRDPESVDFLISVAKMDRDVKVRGQAIQAIGRSPDPRAKAFLEEVLKR
jgi:hypothetical protein